MTNLTTAQTVALNDISKKNIGRSIKAALFGNTKTWRYRTSAQNYETRTVKSLVKKGMIEYSPEGLVITPKGYEATISKINIDEMVAQLTQEQHEADAYNTFGANKQDLFNAIVQDAIDPLSWDDLVVTVRTNIFGTCGQGNVIVTVDVANSNEYVREHGGFRDIVTLDLDSNGTFEIRNMPNRLNPETIDRNMQAINNLVSIAKDEKLMQTLKTNSIIFNDTAQEQFIKAWVAEQS